MEISQKLLCFLFLVSFGAGILAGVLYDLLRFSRMLLGAPMDERDRGIPRSKKIFFSSLCHRFLLFCEDLLFVLIISVALILLLYLINDGQFRWIAPVGMSCGFFVYFVTLGRVFRALSQAMVKWTHRLLFMLLQPLRRICSWGILKILFPLQRMIKKLRWKQEIKRTIGKIRDFQTRATSLFGDIRQ